MYLKLNITVLFLFIGIFQLFAQETREEIEKQADSYFKKEQFIEATPLYLRLLSLEPTNPSYNYKYGTCLLFNSQEKKSAFKYLNYAVQKSKQVDVEAYFYLGKAYHLTFQFDKAIKYYEIYKEKAGTRVVAKLNVDHQIQMCRNGKSLMANINDIIVLNKTKIDKASFFRIYNLTDIGGEILVTAEFQTKKDRKENHIPIIYFPSFSNSNRIYYSSYGENENKDIYVRTRLPNGKWSLPQTVLGQVNTPYDEDYPYMDAQNEYLYFSSKGHNSMGGYDIFRSHYDPETNSFAEPENMDIPISSPDNDFLYIVDSLGRHAYFASQRESEADKIDVYNIRMERIPVKWAILKGQFSSTINPSEKNLSIRVNNNSGVSIGDFQTSSKGDYLIVLPKGGKYEFTMKVGGENKEYTQYVDVPYLKEVRPLKQKIIQTKKEDSSIVVIKNLFDEPFEDENSIIAEALEIKSKLKVNKNQFNLDSLDRLRDEKMALDKVGLSGFTNSEIVALVKNKLVQLSDRNDTTKVLIDKAKTSLVIGNKETDDHISKAETLLTQAKNSTHKGDTEKYTRQAQNEIQKARESQKDVHETKIVLDSLAKDKEKNEQNFNEAKQLNDELKNVDIKDENALANVLSKHQEFVNNELLKKTNTNIGTDYIAQINKKLGNKEELLKQQDKLRNDSIGAQKEVNRLNQDYKNAKSKKQKDNIGLELAQNENQLESINNELNYVNSQLKGLEELDSKKKMIAKIMVGSVQQDLPNSEEISHKSDALAAKRDIVEKDNHEFAEKNGINLSEEPSIASKEDEGKEVVVLTSDEYLQKLDPEYEKDIEELNTAIETGEKSKKDVVKRIRRAVIQVDDAITVMMKDKEANPNSKQIDKNIEELSELKKQLNQKIETLNQEIEAEKEIVKVPKEDHHEDLEALNEKTHQEEPEDTNHQEGVSHRDTIAEDIANNNLETHKNPEEKLIEDTVSTSPSNNEVPSEKHPKDENAIAKNDQETTDTLKVDHNEIAVKPETNKEENKTEDKSFLNVASEQQKQEIKGLNETKNKLLDAEKDNPKLVANKKHQKDLAKVEEQIVEQNNDILDNSIESLKTSTVSNKGTDNKQVKVNLSVLNAQHSKIEIDDLIQEAQKEKDPKKQRELLKSANEKQQESLAVIQEQQNNQRIDHQIQSIISSNGYKNIDPENVTVTEEDLTKEQNDIGVKLLEIKSQINEINSVLPSASKKDKENLIQQKKQLEEIQQKFEAKQQQNQEQISKSEQEKVAINNKGVDVDAINNELSYEDEVTIAQSETYKKLFNSSNQLNQTQFELQVKGEQLTVQKEELKQLRAIKGENNPLSDIDLKAIENQLVKINDTKGEIIDLKNEVETQQNDIKSFIVQDAGQQEKIENMIAREVAPITEMPSLPVMGSGLIMNTDSKSQYSDNNPIPISPNEPKGLIFRVQIGAFNKPVPNNTFAEFSPITGQVVRPGLVRYMAGLFGDRNNANTARDKIRTMGYSDAFVVAYCDGERIPVYRAMQLIASGACVPTIKTSGNAIVSENEISENKGGTFGEELDAYSYNKGVNAAKADVAEAKLGLYYTVQVGVYNTPVSAAQLHNISPLITKRLSNGQIRYSTGIFNSKEEAKPKQLDAIDRGVSDAFITAYFEGKRISLGEAKALLGQKGEEILELKNPTISDRNKIINRPTPDNFTEEKKPFLTDKKLKSMLISKLSFPSYPTQTLNRYNANGQLFYYDSISHHIESFIFEGSFPEQSFMDDFETEEFYNNVYPVLNKDEIKRKEAIKDYDKNSIILDVQISAADLNPDLITTILNAPFNKTMTTSKESIKVKFYTIQTQKGEQLINHLQVLLAKFGATKISKSTHQIDEN